MEPPVEVVWAEEAGPMTWIEAEPEPAPPPREPDFETAWWLNELEASLRPSPPSVAHEGWAVPGVTPDRPPRPAPSGDVQALAWAARRLEATDPVMLSPEQALVDLEALLRTDELLRV